jgi:hypothetical protein
MGVKITSGRYIWVIVLLGVILTFAVLETLGGDRVEPMIFAVMILMFLTVGIAVPLAMFLGSTHEKLFMRILRRIFACLWLYGILGFAGTALVAVTGPMLPQFSFKWPIGYAGGVVRDPSDNYIVFHMPSARVQIYDPNKNFVRGWFVKSCGGHGTVNLTQSGNIEIYTSRGHKFYTFTFDGALIAERPSEIPSGDAALSTHVTSEFFPIPFFLWPFAHPLISWSLFAVGLAGLGALDKKKGKKKRKKAPKATPDIGQQ